MALAEALTSYGLSLGRAHAALERLVVDRTVVLDLRTDDEIQLTERLRQLGVSVTADIVPSDGQSDTTIAEER